MFRLSSDHAQDLQWFFRYAYGELSGIRSSSIEPRAGDVQRTEFEPAPSQMFARAKERRILGALRHVEPSGRAILSLFYGPSEPRHPRHRYGEHAPLARWTATAIERGVKLAAKDWVADLGRADVHARCNGYRGMAHAERVMLADAVIPHTIRGEAVVRHATDAVERIDEVEFVSSVRVEADRMIEAPSRAYAEGVAAWGLWYASDKRETLRAQKDARVGAYRQLVGS